MKELLTVRILGGKPWGFTCKEQEQDDSDGGSAPRMCLEISKVLCDSKASGHLLPGDHLLAIDGVPCKTIEDAKALMLGIEDKLTLTLWRRKPPTASEITKASSTTENTSVVAEQHISVVECELPANNLDAGESRNITEVNDEFELETNNVTMDRSPETKQPKSATLYSSSGQRGSSSTLLPATFSPHQRSPTDQENFAFDRAYMSAVPSSQFSRNSVDYQTCGLPSGTLFRKSTKRTSFAEPLVTVPNNRQIDGNRGRRTSVPAESSPMRAASTPIINPHPTRPSSARPMEPKLMTGSATGRDSSSSNGYIYRAVPVVAQSSWSQTESSVSMAQPDSHHQRMFHKDPVHTDVIKLSGVLRSVPSLSTSKSTPHSSNTSYKYNIGDISKDNWDSEGSSSSGVISSRSSISSAASTVPSSYDNVPSHRLKGRKSLTNTSSSSDELDDYASLAKRRGSESAMPAVRSQFNSSAGDEFGRNSKNLTTIKEVRTYQIKPSDSSLKTSSLYINTGAGSSHSSSASSTPDEFRHKRDASLDSSVSWQSSSTNSSGYSSVALSSSTPTLEMNGSEETLVPPSYMDFRERSNTTDPAKDPMVEANEEGDGDQTKPYRSVSVSEMVRSYSETKIAPTVPPKPRSYSFLPAQSPDPCSQKRAGDITNSLEKVVKKPGISGLSGAYPDPVHSADRKMSTEEKPSQRNILVYVDEPRKKDIQMTFSPNSESLLQPEMIIKKSSQHRPNPVFRTGVHGLVLGTSGAKTSVICELEEPPISEHDAKSSFEMRPDVDSSRPQTRTESDHSIVSTKEKPNEMNLNNSKNEVISRLSAKICWLKTELSEMQREIEENDAAGDDICSKLEEMTDQSTIEKYLHHLKETEEIIALSTNIKNRLSMVDSSIELVQPENKEELASLKAKKTKLISQTEDVRYLQTGIERRRHAFRKLLSEKYMTERDYEDYLDFFTNKMNLLQDYRNLDYKLKAAEEQLICLQLKSTGSLA